ncbi:MAG: hypothetical protein ACTSR5_17190, partial [Promethearchaeota archaeon]
PNLAENDTNTKYYSRKQEIESLTREFIILLKKLKKNGQTLEQGIQSLFFDNNKTPLNKISEITEKLSTLLHYFSEESLHTHPKFLKTLDIDRNAIYLHFKNLELGFGWFRNWSIGDVLLEYDIQNFKNSMNIDFDQYPHLLEEYMNQMERYYCGISERQWLSYVFNGISIRLWKPGQSSISSLTKIGERKINTILSILFKKYRVSNKYELRYLLQRLKAIEILKMGYIALSSKEQSSKTSKIELKKENFYFILCKDVFNLSIGKFYKINECKNYYLKT